jgi:hypothetical protein
VRTFLGRGLEGVERENPNVWYIEKGVNMIQTDRIKELVEFLRKLGDVKHQQNLFVGAFLYIWKK